MSSNYLTKRIFPNAPDWVHRGLFFVGLVWIVVLPIEILQIIENDFLRPSLLGWIIRSFYILGFGTSLAMISALTNASSHPLSSLSVVLLGLLLWSPVYFVSGALLSSDRERIRILGFLLLLVMIIFGCFATATLVFSD